jgi:hypothetical protein
MFNRYFYGLLFIFSFLCVIVLPGCTTQEETSVIGIEVAAETIAATMIIEDFDLSMITIKQLKSDGTFDTIELTSNMLSTEDIEKLSTPGTHQIHVSLLDFETTFNITLRHSDLVTSLMNIHNYAYLEDFTELSYDAWVSTVIGELTNITHVTVNDMGELIIYYHDQTNTNAGQVADPKSIFVINAQLNASGELILHFSDLSTQNLGSVSGIDGVSIVSVDINLLGELIITLSDDSIHNLGIIREVAPMVKVVFRYDNQGYAYDIFWAKVGDQLIAPPNPVRSDYVFKGWYIEDELISFPISVDDVSEIELIAHWDIQLFTYFKQDNKVTITGFAVSNYPFNIIIPEEIDGLPVTKIHESAFENTPERVNEFMSVQFPDSLTHIGIKAFYNNGMLNKLIFGQNSKLSVIQSYAFSNLYLYQPINLPDRLLTIDSYAFQNSSLSQVIFSPNSRLATIGTYAFADNQFLTQFVIPKSTRLIGASAFDNNDIMTLYAYASGPLPDWSPSFNVLNRPIVWRIKSNDIHESLRYVVSDNNDVRILGTTDSSLSLIEIPETILGYPVRRIAAYAFRGHQMRQVHIPDNLLSIGEGAFSYASNMRNIDISSQSLLNEIGSLAFKSSSSLSSFYLPTYVTNIGINAFQDCSSLTLYTTQSTEGTLWQSGWNPGGRPINYQYAGAGKTDDVYYVMNSSNQIIITGPREHMNSLLIPDQINEHDVIGIGASAFRSTSMNNLLIPSHITYIGENAFQYAGYLAVFTTHSSQPIGWHTNFNPSNRVIQYGMLDLGSTEDLNYVVMPTEDITIVGASRIDSNLIIPNVIGIYPVTTLAKNAFRDASWLSSIDLGTGIKTIETQAFYDTGLESLYIPANVTTIEQNAFIYNESLIEVVYDENSAVSVIEATTYYGAIQLEEVILPPRLITIGAGAFSGAKKLKAIWIPKTVTDIQNTAFANNQSLESVIFEDTSQLLTIKDQVFVNCSSIQFITLPEGLLSIGYGGFQQTSLIEIHLPDSVTEIGGFAFNGIPSLVHFHISEDSNLNSIGNFAFAYNPKLESIIIPIGVTVIGLNAFSGTTDCIIYARISVQPTTWHALWNVNNLPVIWGYTG